MFDVEHILLTNPDNPKIREVTTRMSRYVCGLESEQECLTEKAYIVETTIPIIFSRYTPDKVATKEYVYLIPKQEKNGSRIFFTPGVIALIMFMKKGPLDENSVKAAQLFFMDYFVRQIDNSCTNGNDVLINGKKIMGITVLANNINNTVMIRFMLTLKSKFITIYSRDEDFAERKYKGITGVCDETGIDEDTIREMVNGFIDIALSWRPENAAE